MTDHKTSKIKRADKAKFYREQAKFVLELLPDRNILFAAGTIIDHLKKCKVPGKQISNIEQKFIHELLKWDNYDAFIKIAFQFANIVQAATGSKVYIDVLNRR